MNKIFWEKLKKPNQRINFFFFQINGIYNFLSFPNKNVFYPIFQILFLFGKWKKSQNAFVHILAFVIHTAQGIKCSSSAFCSCWCSHWFPYMSTSVFLILQWPASGSEPPHLHTPKSQSFKEEWLRVFCCSAL